MRTSAQTRPGSRKKLWAGRFISLLAVLFLAFDGVIKVMKLSVAVQGTVRLGFPESTIRGIGLLELACLALYIVPRSSVLGAILLTGYLGGAIAAHARIGSPLFSQTLFPVYVAALIWGGLFLLDGRVSVIVLPLSRNGSRQDARDIGIG